MKQKIMRIGIIGTGRIAHRFVPEAREVNCMEVIAVYNPKIASAKKIAEELDIEYATDNLVAFTSLVDAVYIAAPHETHVDYCRQMLKAGKHVLCEKPMSFSGAEIEELHALAKENRLILMEAVKTAYCPGFQGLLEIVGSGKIGKVVDVEACFTKLVLSNVREVTDIEYGGSFTELGTYVLLPIVKLLGTESKEVRFWSKHFENGLDSYSKVMLDYGHATATGKVGLGAKSEGQLIVTGTKGYIVVPAPWWLTKRVEIHYEDPAQVDVYEFPFEGAGLRYEVQELVNRVTAGSDALDEKSCGVSIGESAWIAGMMEKFLDDSNR